MKYKKECFPERAYEEDPYLRSLRWLAYPFVRLFLILGLTANMVTFAGMLLVLVGAYLLAFGNYTWAAIGGLLFIVASVFDKIDGPLARIRGTSNVGMQYVDYLFDQFVGVGLTYAALGLYVFNQGFGEQFALLSLSALLFYLFGEAAIYSASRITGNAQSHSKPVKNFWYYVKLLVRWAHYPPSNMLIVLVAIVVQVPHLLVAVWGVTYPILFIIIAYQQFKGVQS